MTIDNSKFIDELEKRVGEFDYLFQEWVVFTADEAHKIKELAHEILAIRNDSFFNIEWDKRTPMEKHIDKMSSK